MMNGYERLLKTQIQTYDEMYVNPLLGFHDSRIKILPTQESLTLAWPENNFLNAIVQTKPTGYTWLMNTHIQTYGSIYKNTTWRFTDNRITFHPAGYLRAGIYDLCPFIRKYVVPKGIILENYPTFTDFLQYAFDKNFYVYTIIDEFFREDVETSFHHPCYFYGYDLNKKLIFAADNFENGKYQEKQIPFDIVNEAFTRYPSLNFDAAVHMYELYDYNFCDNAKFMADQIRDYLDSGKPGICYLNRLNCPSPVYEHSDESGEIFLGIDCYRLLQKQLEQHLYDDPEKSDDMRSFVFLCDHKRLMQLRHKHLQEKNLIARNKPMDDRHTELYNHSIELLNLIIGYGYTRRKEDLKEALKLLKQIRREDIACMNYLLQALTTPCG